MGWKRGMRFTNPDRYDADPGHGEIPDEDEDEDEEQDETDTDEPDCEAYEWDQIESE